MKSEKVIYENNCCSQAVLQLGFGPQIQVLDCNGHVHFTAYLSVACAAKVHAPATLPCWCL